MLERPAVLERQLERQRYDARTDLHEQELRTCRAPANTPKRTVSIARPGRERHTRPFERQRRYARPESARGPGEEREAATAANGARPLSSLAVTMAAALVSAALLGSGGTAAAAQRRKCGSSEGDQLATVMATASALLLGSRRGCNNSGVLPSFPPQRRWHSSGSTVAATATAGGGSRSGRRLSTRFLW